MSSKPRASAPRLAKPAVRYWQGKAPKGVADTGSDSEDEEEQQEEILEDGDQLIQGDFEASVSAGEEDEPESVSSAKKLAVKSMNIALKDVNISKDGKVIISGREESGRTLVEQEQPSENEDDEEEEELKKEDEEESSEYESSSEEEPAVPQYRPVFIPKRARITVLEREAAAEESEEALRRKQLAEEERKKQSHDMVVDSIRRELAEKETEELIPDVDDIDGLDPAAEFEAWRLRELGRIKWEKEIEIAREEERAEIERRRALPEEQRNREDAEHAQATRDAKPKGQQKFLQKYWHKGAFRQDEDILRRHDYTEATESYTEISSLPSVMQVKNFGKRSRTKYTHLANEDTTRDTGGFGGHEQKPGAKTREPLTCHICGGPHLKRDCPNNVGGIPSKAVRDAVGTDGEWRGREPDSGYGRIRRRSRSRSPPGRGRSRSKEGSLDNDRYKRRKFEERAR